MKSNGRKNVAIIRRGKTGRPFDFNCYLWGFSWGGFLRFCRAPQFVQVVMLNTTSIYRQWQLSKPGREKRSGHPCAGQQSLHQDNKPGRMYYYTNLVYARSFRSIVTITWRCVFEKYRICGQHSRAERGPTNATATVSLRAALEHKILGKTSIKTFVWWCSLTTFFH